MPTPVSRDLQPGGAVDRAGRRTRISPSKVNFTAFESRLRTIFSHMSRSTKTGAGSGGQSTTSRSPARSVAERNVLASRAV